MIAPCRYTKFLRFREWLCPAVPSPLLTANVGSDCCRENKKKNNNSRTARSMLSLLFIDMVHR